MDYLWELINTREEIRDNSKKMRETRSSLQIVEFKVDFRTEITQTTVNSSNNSRIINSNKITSNNKDKLTLNSIKESQEWILKLLDLLTIKNIVQLVKITSNNNKEIREQDQLPSEQVMAELFNLSKCQQKT